MTYDRSTVGDEKLLDILFAARAVEALVCVHAENHGMITWMGKRLVEKGYAAPKYHTVSHPRGCEAEAFNRLITFAEFIDQPIMIFHVSTAEGVAVIRPRAWPRAQSVRRNLPAIPVHDGKDLDKPGLEGAKWMCSPPPRSEADQEAIWQGLGAGRPAAGLLRSRALRLRRHRQAQRRPDPDLQADRQRHAGHRVAPAVAVRRHGVEGPARAAEVRRADGHGAGQDLQPCTRARARSPLAPMPTSSFGTPSAQVTLADGMTHDGARLYARMPAAPSPAGRLR